MQTIDRDTSRQSVQSIRDTAQQSCSSFEKCVGDNPGTAMLISGVVGIGVGIAIGMMLGRAHEPEPVGWFDSRTAEKIGHQFLASMSRLVPESVSSRFQN
jgi:hypothetical protein